MARLANYVQRASKALLTGEEVNDLINGRTFGNATPNPAGLAFEEWMSAEDAEKQSEYITFRRYYDGEPVNYTLTDRMREFLELDANTTFAMNYIPIAVDIINERLELDYFEVVGDDDAPENQRQGGNDGIIAGWLSFNKIATLQDDLHHYMLRDGDSFAVAEWDTENNMPRIYPIEADDGVSGVYVSYDENNEQRIKFAVKRWRVETGQLKGNTRLNVYTDDAVYKYITGNSGFVPFFEEEGDPFPLPWVDKSGNPLGLTVIHFDGKKSQIKDLISPQDAINKTIIDELAGADIEGFGMITLTSSEPPFDDAGNSTVEIGPRRIMWAGDGAWGTIPAGDLSGLTMIVDKYVQRMAQIARIALAYYQITGQIASAATQKADDSGMVSKIGRIAKLAGGSWEDVIDACRRLHNAFSTDPELPEGSITAVWKSFERVDKNATDKTESETAKIKAETFSMLVEDNPNADRAALARMAGYDDDEARVLATTSAGFVNDGLEQ